LKKAALTSTKNSPWEIKLDKLNFQHEHMPSTWAYVHGQN